MNQIVFEWINDNMFIVIRNWLHFMLQWNSLCCFYIFELNDIDDDTR